VLSRRVRRLTRSAALGRLDRERDGELVYVRGRVRARATLPAILSERQAVYRRVTVRAPAERLVHEAATDFWLEDDQGGHASVEVAKSRLLAKAAPFRVYSRSAAWDLLSKHLARRDTLVAPHVGVPRHRVDQRTVAIGEQLLGDGDEVEVWATRRRWSIRWWWRGCLVRSRSRASYAAGPSGPCSSRWATGAAPPLGRPSGPSMRGFSMVPTGLEQPNAGAA
jgi:hypothetical protein